MHHWFILFWAPDPHSQLPTGHCPLDDHRHLEVTIYESEFTFIYWNESPTLCYLVLLFLVNVLGWSLTSSQDITLLPPTWKPDDKNLLVLLPFNIASTSAALQDLISFIVEPTSKNLYIFVFLSSTLSSKLHPCDFSLCGLKFLPGSLLYKKMASC